ncbi:ribonucleoside-diphosphate reductase large subunit [Acanthamoeba polyphaga mimivirus]|uniref:Ribonucleoside-diphosphate reductase n=1 Tax=Acanthamoeba polyphaga mimivirus Kroon TaxID=3069720 RepID=A0A0G2Y2S4_9VIRU|nr:ribonucleoside-diphosphate reductase large subunit [Acanthamoeba polyphaga mimivirus]AKI80048.1 ribonucleoside-diphosphate reductase large subunit [Acanthamoeba polyphaga mimivirus Kroon]
MNSKNSIILDNLADVSDIIDYEQNNIDCQRSIKNIEQLKSTEVTEITNNKVNKKVNKTSTILLEVSKETIYLDHNGSIQVITSEIIRTYVEKIFEKMEVTHLDIDKMTKNIFPKLKSINTIKDIDNQIISTASEMVTDHYDYPKIAVWILMTNLHDNTSDDFLETAEKLYNNKNKSNKNSPIISENLYNFIKEHNKEINRVIRYDRDYNLTIFGFRTLEKSYLKRINKKIVERPQHLFMRVAITLHYRKNDLDRIFETYKYLSKGYFTHATPTLFNAGTTHEQLSSCFLLGIGDSLEEISECWKECALISKYAGGIGIHMTNIRVEGAYIASTQGEAGGLRVLTIFNDISRYANQGGKRPGSFAIFIEPWHGDIFFFLDLKKNTGAETERARDLFLGLMINDIFMERVYKDDVWSLMCPSQCPNLLNKYGDEFTKEYLKYESEGTYLKQIRAIDLWFKIMESQIETGVPYIMFKDAINDKSNQINIGVVNGSNLCCEIVEVSDKNNFSVCNLSSICLPRFVKIIDEVPTFNYQKLFNISRILTRNLNNIIDINFYPLDKTRITNLRDRPIGIGVQGLADVFAMFKTPFDSEIARDLNRKIFETIYYGALTESNKLAREFGTYQTYQGSPISQGKFQFDLWNFDKSQLSGMWDWELLRQEILKHGVRNSLVTTCMPTASTSQIMGWNECIEPYTENIYSRSTMAGEYFVINKHLIKDLIELGIWNSEMVDLIKYYKGSVANIPNIPDNIKAIYRTVWEIPQKSIIEMAADRAPFVDQTQSMNLYIDKPSFAKLNSCLFYAWRKGLKTGMYYLRSKPASSANQFGIDINKIKEIESKNGIKKQEDTFDLSDLTNSINQQVSGMVCRFVPAHLRKPGECMSCDG